MAGIASLAYAPGSLGADEFEDDEGEDNGGVPMGFSLYSSKEMEGKK